ncbi:MAG: DJ-1/PfpI family protein [Clostridiales bacterium]|nr:DJ-1/PfpI family protein [Clostridiales bacterium]
MKKVYIFLGDGFETVEALMSVDVLRRGGVDVETVSIMNDIKVLSSHNVEVKADIMLKDAELDSCEMMILPGGLGGTNNIKANDKLISALKAQAEKGKYVCAICAAPSALGINGILKGKKATVYPGFEAEMKGAEVTGENVTVDGNIITGKGPGMALEFALTLLNTLKGEKVCADVKAGMLL